MITIEEIKFIGIGTLDGRKVKIQFKTTGENIKCDQEDRNNPELIIMPLLNEERKSFVDIEILNEDFTGEIIERLNNADNEHIVPIKELEKIKKHLLK